MKQEQWRHLDRKFACLGITFDEAEFAKPRCLRCSKILYGRAFYCDSCLVNFAPEALEHLKIQEYLCLLCKMILLGVLKKTKEDHAFPNPDPEFKEYILESMIRDYQSTGVPNRIGFKNPDVTNYLRFYLENGVHK